MNDLFDWTSTRKPETLPYVASSATSKAAAESMERSAPRMRDRVLATILAHPEGLSSDDVESITGLRHQTASARMRELSQAGLIRDSGVRRPTRSGRNAAVFRAVAS